MPMSTVISLREPEGLRSRLGAEIRSRMARYNISQTALASAMGLSQSQISKRLRGAIAFNTDELEQVANVLQTTVVSLLTGTETAPRPDGPRGGDGVRREGIEPPTRWLSTAPSQSRLSSRDRHGNRDDRIAA